MYSVLRLRLGRLRRCAAVRPSCPHCALAWQQSQRSRGSAERRGAPRHTARAGLGRRSQFTNRRALVGQFVHGGGATRHRSRTGRAQAGRDRDDWRAILAALHRQTKTIPIVFTLVTDPVSDGFVASLARPGGNITGFTIFEHSFAGKWLEMLKEVVPSMTRVAVMQNPDHPAWNAYLRAIGAIASGMGIEVTPAPVSSPAEIETALAAFAASRTAASFCCRAPWSPEPRGDRRCRAAPSPALDLSWLAIIRRAAA